MAIQENSQVENVPFNSPEGSLNPSRFNRTEAFLNEGVGLTAEQT